MDVQRKSGRRRTISLPAEELPDGPAEQDVESVVMSAFGTEALIDKVRALPGDQADVLLLRIVGGLDVESSHIGRSSDLPRIWQRRPSKTFL